MDLPDLHAWSDGEVPDGDLLNATLGRAVTLLRNPPRAMVRLTSTQSITSHATNMYPISWNQEPFDPDGMVDLTGAPTRLTVVTPGTYLLSGQVGWAGSSAGMRRVRWAKNGTLVEYQSTEYPGGTAAISMRAPTILAALATGDYIELQVGQDSGSGLNVSPGTPTNCQALALWVAAL